MPSTPRTPLRLLVFIGALALIGTSQGAITLTLNTTTQTLSFSGSDTGTPFPIPGEGFVGWRSTGYTGVPATFKFPAFFTSISTLAETTTRLFQPETGSLFAIFLPNPGDAPFGVITVTADPTKIFAYGSVLNAAQAAALEATVAGNPTIPQIASSGFAPIHTQVVPEPGVAALLILAGALLTGKRNARRTHRV